MLRARYRPAERDNASCRTCDALIPKGALAFFRPSYRNSAIICTACVNNMHTIIQEPANA